MLYEMHFWLFNDLNFIILILFMIGSVNANEFSIKIDRNKNQLQIFTLYLIVDSNLYQQSQESTENRIQSIFILINKIYLPLGIQFQIICIEIWKENLIEISQEEYILEELKIYKTKSVNINHDCLHLFLGSNYFFTRQGRAEFTTMCSKSSCVGYTVDSITQNIKYTAYTVSHELAHNFGLTHDTSDCGCENCIMATGVEFSSRKLDWSSCSISQIKSLLKLGFPCHSHLAQFPTTIFVKISRRQPMMKSKRTSSINISICGNGIVENGEQCDCGKRSDCEKCCNFLTCKFSANSQCASGSCCNTEICKLYPTGTICRNSTTFCDLTEYCNGQDENCPIDIFRQDGTECLTKFNNKAHCFGGQCKDHGTQCRFLWGQTSNMSHSSCYDENTEENHAFKNCGLMVTLNDKTYFDSFLDWPTKPCQKSNSICGRLWCIHDNEKVMQIGLSKSYSFTTKTNQFCEASRFEVDWNNRDIGMVPDGAVCGNKMVCSNGDCVPLDGIFDKSCHCFNNGICTNQKKCQCFQQYLPPNCSERQTIKSTMSTSPYTRNLDTENPIDKSNFTEKYFINILRENKILKIILGVLLPICFLIILILNRRKLKTSIHILFQRPNLEIIDQITSKLYFIKENPINKITEDIGNRKNTDEDQELLQLSKIAT